MIDDRAVAFRHHTDTYIVRSDQPQQALSCGVCLKNVKPYVITWKKKAFHE